MRACVCVYVCVCVCMFELNRNGRTQTLNPEIMRQMLITLLLASDHFFVLFSVTTCISLCIFLCDPMDTNMHLRLL